MSNNVTTSSEEKKKEMKGCLKRKKTDFSSGALCTDRRVDKQFAWCVQTPLTELTATETTKQKGKEKREKENK